MDRAETGVSPLCGSYPDAKPIVKQKSHSLQDLQAENIFYFNREWWRQRVRMYTPNASDHANGVRIVHNYVQTNETCREYDTNNI